MKRLALLLAIVTLVLAGTANASKSSDAAYAARINSVLAKRGSPLAGWGKTFVAAGRRYRINPSLLLGIAGKESTYGLAECGKNPFGWMPFCGFSDYSSAIWTVTRGLRLYYANEGRTTVLAVALKYNPSNPYNWASDVTSYMWQFGNGVKVEW